MVHTLIVLRICQQLHYTQYSSHGLLITKFVQSSILVGRVFALRVDPHEVLYSRDFSPIPDCLSSRWLLPSVDSVRGIRLLTRAGPCVPPYLKDTTC